MDVPHIRAVMPKDRKGQVSTAQGARIYITFPGEPERALTSVRTLAPVWSVDEPGKVTVELYATIEVTWE
jgi:hypothetical protein